MHPVGNGWHEASHVVNVVGDVGEPRVAFQAADCFGAGMDKKDGALETDVLERRYEAAAAETAPSSWPIPLRLRWNGDGRRTPVRAQCRAQAWQQQSKGHSPGLVGNLKGSKPQWYELFGRSSNAL